MNGYSQSVFRKVKKRPDANGEFMTNTNTPVSMLERIRSPEWRAHFICEISAIHGFDDILQHSRNPQFEMQPDLFKQVYAQAIQILACYPKEELRTARQHYNTQQLLAFWRHYDDLINRGISKGLISKRFPLLTARFDPVNNRVVLDGIKISQMKGGVYIKDSNSEATFSRREIDQRRVNLEYAPFTNDVLDSLEGRLTFLVHLVRQSSSILYAKFLLSESQAASDVWDAYRIHVFLDNFMYRDIETGLVGSSKFDFIFAPSNCRELIVWFKAALISGKHITIGQVREFLGKQTKYYARLSQRITLAENEVLNTHKEFLFYDESEGVVRMGSIPQEVFDPANDRYMDLAITSMGCPFGRVIGARDNALFEIFQYFNNLFIRVLEESWEFGCLFRK